MTHETHRGMMKEIAEKVNTTLDVFQSMSEILTEKQGKYEKTVMEASKLLWAAMYWVIESNHEKEKMKKEMERKEEEIKKLGEKVREDEKEKERKEEELKKLGEKVRENEKEKERKEEEIKKLGEKLIEDEKEKERMKETLVGLGEEKREAIRQVFAASLRASAIIGDSMEEAGLPENSWLREYFWSTTFVSVMLV
ncbi:unnamed protein product [Brassica rapa subsp. trilocularis]